MYLIISLSLWTLLTTLFFGLTFWLATEIYLHGIVAVMSQYLPLYRLRAHLAHYLGFITIEELDAQRIASDAAVAKVRAEWQAERVSNNQTIGAYKQQLWKANEAKEDAEIDLKNFIYDVKEANSECKAKASELCTLRTELGHCEDGLARAKGEIKTLNSHIEAQEATIDELQSTVEELESGEWKDNQLSILANSVAQHQQRTNDAESATGVLQRQLDEAKREKISLKARIKTLENDKSNLLFDRATLISKCQNLEMYSPPRETVVPVVRHINHTLAINDIASIVSYTGSLDNQYGLRDLVAHVKRVADFADALHLEVNEKASELEQLREKANTYASAVQAAVRSESPEPEVVVKSIETAVAIAQQEPQPLLPEQAQQFVSELQTTLSVADEFVRSLAPIVNCQPSDKPLVIFKACQDLRGLFDQTDEELRRLKSSTSSQPQSAFGQPFTTASGSGFGQSPSAFGQSMASGFGQPSSSSASGQSSGSGFGQQSTSSVFGQTQPSTSGFGAPSVPASTWCSSSGSGSGFGQPSSSSSSVFGKPSSSPSGFSQPSSPSPNPLLKQVRSLLSPNPSNSNSLASSKQASSHN
jgi:cell division protein FtsB